MMKDVQTKHSTEPNDHKKVEIGGQFQIVCVNGEEKCPVRDFYFWLEIGSQSWINVPFQQKHPRAYQRYNDQVIYQMFKEQNPLVDVGKTVFRKLKPWFIHKSKQE